MFDLGNVKNRRGRIVTSKRKKKIYGGKGVGNCGFPEEVKDGKQQKFQNRYLVNC